MALVADSWLWWVGGQLVTGSLQGAVIIGLVWLVCRRATHIPASVRAFLWWLASLKLVVALLPFPSVAVPLLPAPQIATSSVWQLSTSSPLVPESRAQEYIPLWLIAVIGVWLVGVAAQSFQLLAAYVSLRPAVRRSRPLASDDGAIVDRLGRVLGLRTAPAVRVSDDVSTPLVVGVLRPTVLIPATPWHSRLTSGQWQSATSSPTSSAAISCWDGYPPLRNACSSFTHWRGWPPASTSRNERRLAMRWSCE